MRKISNHTINPDLEPLLVQAVDQPGPGGANHHYLIRVDSPDDPQRDGNPGQPREILDLHFQEGPVYAYGINGVTNAALLAIIIDRLDGFQRGQFPCSYNANATHHVRKALEALHDRTKSRISRGVEGTNQA